jgi:hypothetical protein
MKYAMTFVISLFLVGCYGDAYDQQYILLSEVERLIPKCDINDGVKGFVMQKVFFTPPGVPINLIVAVECNNGATFTDSIDEQAHRAKILWDNRNIDSLTL